MADFSRTPRTVTAYATAALVVVLALALPATARGASNGDTGSEARGPHALGSDAGGSSEVRSVLDIPPPPGLGQEDLYQTVRRVKQRGTKTLEEVLAEVDPPAYLVPAPAAGEERNQTQSAPSLAAQRAYAAGRLAMRSGARFEALRQLEKAARLAPDHAAIRAALGELLAASGDLQAARKHLQRAVERDPLRTRALYLLGKDAVRAKRHRAAVHLLHAVIERAPRDPRSDPALPRVARYHLAAALAGLNRPAAAAKQLARFHNEPYDTTHVSREARELRLLERRRGRTLRLLGDLYLRLDRPADALKNYRRAGEGSLQDVRLAARVLYAELLTGQRDRAQQVALSLFRNPRHRNAGVALLNYLRERGVSSDALVAELREAYQASNRDTGTALALAELLPPQAARSLLRQHLAHRPGDTGVLLKLLRLHLGEQPNDAEIRSVAGILAALLAEHPQRSAPWSEVFFRIVDDDARAARLLADAADAVEQNASGEAEDPKHGPERVALAGIALARAGRPTDARPLLERALAARPDLIAARMILARIVADDGQVDRALELLRDIGADSPAPAIALKVRLLATRERAQQALDLLEAAGLDGDKPTLTTLRARLLMRQDRIEQAEQLLLDALNTDPEEERYYALLFELYDREDAPARSVDAYRRLLDRAMREIPDKRVTNYRLGELHLASRNYQQAQAHLLPLVRRNPGDAAALDLLLEAYQRSGREKLGVALLDRVLKTQGDNPAVLELAREYYDNAGLQRRAAEVAIRQLKLQPASPERNRKLAMAYLNTERLDQARTLIDALLQDDGDNPENLYLAMALHQRTGDEAARIRITERLIRARFDGAQQKRALATFFLRTDQTAKSVPLLEELLDPDPAERDDQGGGAPVEAPPQQAVDNGQLSLMLAHAYLRLDRAADALELLDKAAGDHPELAGRILYQRARAHDMLGDPDAAERDLRQAIEQGPRDPGPRNALAYRWAQNNRNLDEALVLAKRAVALDGDTSAFLDTLGWVHYKRGEFPQAVQWLERARLAEGGENPIIIDHLGDALYRLGRHERAMRAWKQAAELLEAEGKDWGDDPELEGLDQRLKRKIEAMKNGDEPPAAVVPSEVSA